MLSQELSPYASCIGFLVLCCGCTAKTATSPADVAAGRHTFNRRPSPQVGDTEAVETPLALAFSASGDKLVITSNTKPSTASLTWSHEVRVVDLSMHPAAVERHRLGIIDTDLLDFGVGTVGGPVFSQDGSQLLWVSPRRASSGSTCIIDVPTMRAVRLLDRDSTSPVTAVQFSPDGHHVAFCGRAQGITTDGRAGPVDGVVDVWDIQTGELLVKHEWRNGGYNTMQFSRDGRLCAAGGGGTIDRSGSGRVVLFDMHTAKLIETMDSHREPVVCLAFAPDSKQLISGASDGALKFWDVSADHLVLIDSVTPASLPMHPAAVAISPDGALIVVAMANFNRGQNSGELVVLDAASRATLAVLLKSKSFEIVSAAISPDGSRLAAIDSNGELYMWDITVLTKGAGK